MSDSQSTKQILYCHCAHSKVVPAGVKAEVLRWLTGSSLAFEAVPDLCEMSARKDPALRRLAASEETCIVACFPRAVEWLFHAGGAPLPEDGIEVLNMREASAAEVCERLQASLPAEQGADQS